jgi:hypothetical protein
MHLLPILIHEASLLEDAVQGCEREIITRFPGNGHPPRLRGVFVLAVTSLLILSSSWSTIGIWFSLRYSMKFHLGRPESWVAFPIGEPPPFGPSINVYYFSTLLWGNKMKNLTAGRKRS